MFENFLTWLKALLSNVWRQLSSLYLSPGSLYLSPGFLISSPKWNTKKKKFNQNFDWQRGIQFSAFKAISSWQLLSNLNNSLGSKFSAYSKNISHAKKKRGRKTQTVNCYLSVAKNWTIHVKNADIFRYVFTNKYPRSNKQYRMYSDTNKWEEIVDGRKRH